MFRSNVPGTSSMLLAQSAKCPAEGRNADWSVPLLRCQEQPSEPRDPPRRRRRVTTVMHARPVREGNPSLHPADEVLQ